MTNTTAVNSLPMRIRARIRAEQAHFAKLIGSSDKGVTLTASFYDGYPRVLITFTDASGILHYSIDEISYNRRGVDFAALWALAGGGAL